MRCRYCNGPISRVRGLGKSQPEDKNRTFYRCLICGADYVVAREPLSSGEARQAGRRQRQLQPVWPRAMG